MDKIEEKYYIIFFLLVVLDKMDFWLFYYKISGCYRLTDEKNYGKYDAFR